MSVDAIPGEHIARRPTWDCRKCGAPWPCAPAKVELSEEYRFCSPGLGLYLASCLLEAIDSYRDSCLGAANVPPDLSDRFLGWIHPQPPDTVGVHPGGR